MGEAATQITNQKPLTDVEQELWDIHQGFFGITGMLRMITMYASEAEDQAQAAADVAEAVNQYIPIVDALRIRLDTAICRLR